MNDDPSNTALPLDEQLVAYLDGELDPESRRRIEELLATDAEFRRRLQEMERTWELLDDLDAAPAGDRFAHSTLEMVAVAARQDVEQSLAEAPRRRRRRRWALGGGLLTAAAIGFLAVVLWWPDPNRQLLEDLPVLENLDEYRQIDDVEFLDMLLQLDKDGLLPKETGETPKEPATQQNNSLEQRWQQVEGMTPGEKEQLRRLQERFDVLAPDEKQRLQQLDDAVQGSADASQLRQVILRYYEWLKTLPSYTRAELMQLKPQERIKSVKEGLEKEQAREGGQRPGGKDMEALRQWMNECAAGHEAQFLKMLPESRQKELAQWTPAARHRMMLSVMWRRWQATGPDKPPPMMTDEDLARLRARLSPETRERLESKPTSVQWQMVAGWMHRQRPAHGTLSKADDERLANFFEKELTPGQRDRLLSLPGEEMQRELQRLYLNLTRIGPRDGPGRRPNGFQRGPRPGGDRSPPKRPENGKKSEPRPTPTENR